LINGLDLNSFDALAVPGGAGFFIDAYEKEFLALIQHFHNADKPVASVCVASLSLRKAGIMNGRRATVSCQHHVDHLG
jgi:4-methyl-5(b-hydroxyethyl)-thiazole monophosphate biosynthesis